VNWVREAVCVNGAEIESELMDIVDGEESRDAMLWDILGFCLVWWTAATEEREDAGRRKNEVVLVLELLDSLRWWPLLLPGTPGIDRDTRFRKVLNPDR